MEVVDLLHSATTQATYKINVENPKRHVRREDAKEHVLEATADHTLSGCKVRREEGKESSGVAV